MRTVTVPAKESIYRAKVEPATKGILRKRHGYRFVIERMWSKIPTGMRYEDDWKYATRGPWCVTHGDAELGAIAWLDRAEASVPDEGDFVR